MERRAINLYTSKPADAGFRSLADLLSREQPVNLCDISDLPQPDRQRPTRQQLRRELGEQQQSLSMCRDMIKLMAPHPRLAPELADLRADEQKYETRIAEILQQLGLQEGGQAA